MPAHPHFDDKGAVAWHTDWDAALAQAAAEGKRLFIESGRKACSNCRVLVEGLLPRPEVRDYLNKHFVCLADDCDEMAEPVRLLGVANMPWAGTLPFVMLADASGKWLGGLSGATTPTSLMNLLRAAAEGGK